MANEANRRLHNQDMAQLAEWLATEQLNLLAEVEAQVRAVHHTMRRIEQLRQRRGSPELTNGERGKILTGLADEITELEGHISAQSESCQAMQSTIVNMQQRLAAVKQAREQPPADGTRPSSTGGADA
jgi:chromosome segregation ATPase